MPRNPGAIPWKLCLYETIGYQVRLIFLNIYCLVLSFASSSVAVIAKREIIELAEFLTPIIPALTAEPSDIPETIVPEIFVSA